MALRIDNTEANITFENGNPVWANCVNEQRSLPLAIVKPETLQQLVGILTDAHRLGHRVHAAGSGHSFSDITNCDNAVLVSMQLLRRLSMVDNGEDGIVAITPPTSISPNDDARARFNAIVSRLRDPGDTANRSRKLARVQAGITIRDLNTELDNRNLSLLNMGGYDGQTLAGAMSTATHGSGITYGPLPSFVRAIVLVSENGTVYQIEPGDNSVGNGPLSNSSIFPNAVDGVPVVLKQDNDWFRAALVSIGCLGVIYSYVIEVRDAFFIREMRTATKWDDIRKELLPELWAPVAPIVAGADHFELVLNPYMSWSHSSCIRVERMRMNGKARKSGERKDWLGALLVQFSIYSVSGLVGLLNRLPVVSPIAINKAIATLVESDPYIDKSFRVFNLGAANGIKAQALELHCNAAQCVPVIDNLLTVFNEEAKRHNWYMAGPLGIRFTGPSDAFLAPETGRMTCSIELDMLVGVETGASLAQSIKEHVCTNDTSSVRVHWGLDLGLVTADDVRAWYPDFPAWHAVYQQLNSTGMFNNKFTDRIGISTPD
ncbi:FAD-dependent oxidoreductase [Grosmannia clavigera kw1407]|uniref:D-arabinono-1,4-lactone oxidase n=1 Tax=Grosmannia clavigera (strain kw1407 / UAMH 11150) TaxID=655863 RepID=F0XNE3_GROCL|nr:FAD-dependent oxidoreductase [Grosmannia clavigera kw1407]EFX00925.1 FAD-dependent oxidoreductase [Grosmannia clavigera kw1407]